MHILRNLTLALLMSLSLAAAADLKSQWRFVLESSISQSQEGLNKAQSLLDDATRLSKEARSRFQKTFKTEHNDAARHYEQAQRAFSQAQGQYQQAVADFNEILQRSQVQFPQAQNNGIRQQLIRVHKSAQQIAQSAVQSLNQGINEFNRGAALYQDSLQSSSKLIQDHTRNQAQGYAFQVQRMTGFTKSALIRVRDQAKLFQLPNCESDLSGRYQAVLKLLDEARLIYRDAASLPSNAEAKFDQGGALLAQAREISSGVLDQYDVCLKGK